MPGGFGTSWPCPLSAFRRLTNRRPSPSIPYIFRCFSVTFKYCKANGYYGDLSMGVEPGIGLRPD